MLRLFFSLYFIIIVGLFTINWGSELLWQKINPNKIDPTLTSSLQLAKALPNLVTNNNQQLKQFYQDTSLAIQFVEKQDYAWLPQQQLAFTQKTPVVIYNDKDQAQIFVQSKSPGWLIQLGPIEKNQSYPLLKYVLFVCSYIILAFFISIWLQPVWRDLNYLKTTANKIMADNFDLSKQTRSRSPISSIVDSVHQMAERIVGLLAEQKELIDAVSHELRTPVARLRFAVAMIDHLPQEQALEIDQDIIEIESLIDEMLSYSRLERMPETLERSNVDVYELLLHLIHKTKRTTAIDINIEKNTEQTVFYCQGDLIERACQNLLSNAVRYANKKIEITLKTNADDLIIEIADDGQGIALPHIDDVFKPFHRLEQSRNKSEGGYGLGLAIVKKAAQWHQGDCTAGQSNKGGATFTFTINVAKPF